MISFISSMHAGCVIVLRL